MIGNKVLSALEFDKILERVAEYAVLDRTKRELSVARPVCELAFAEQLLEKTQEADLLLYKYGAGGVEYFDDLGEELSRAQVGATLSCAELLRIGRLLKSSRISRASVCREEWEDTAILREIAGKIFVESALEGENFSKILTEDSVSDNASEKLASLRRSIRQVNARIREKLNSYIRGGYSKYLQDAIVTKRGDRYVLPVRQEFRGRVRGLIHDQSSTGATLFIEPEQVLEMNNELKTLQMEEANEIERILAELSGRVARIHERLEWNIQNLVELDGCFARAIYSYKNRCARPRLNARGAIELRKGRHPLIPADSVVPLDVSLGENYRFLLITGPNTGGKTVTLKLVGLCSLMAMCGIFIPAAEGSVVSVFEEIFTDIGDDQSIEQSLSTFSSHMKNIVEITRRVSGHSLVLIDEIGAGTDPEEGAALALAVIGRLLSRKAAGIITTHYSALKEYAFSEPLIRNASMEFDAETYTPLYRLNIGIPGSSNAIEISRKLGLEPALADEAVGYLSDRKINFEKVLKRAEETRLAAERERAELSALLVREKEMVAAAEKERESLSADREKLTRNAKIESRRIVNERMEEAEEIVGRLRALLEKQELSGGDLIAARTLKNKLEGKKYEIEKEPERRAPAQPARKEALRKGDRVYVRSADSFGTVERVSPKKPEAEVLIGSIRMTAKISDLFLSDSVSAPTAKKSISASVKITRSAEISQPRREIKVIGKNVSETLSDVDEFIDKAVMDGLEEVKIIHGVGQGILRAAIWDYLRAHPSVKEFRSGVYGEGEKGVTIIALK